MYVRVQDCGNQGQTHLFARPFLGNDIFCGDFCDVWLCLVDMSNGGGAVVQWCSGVVVRR